MHALCHDIVGRDLQNAELFWNILSGGEVQADVKRLSSGSHPHFRLPDGSVWMFSYEDLGGIHQLCATDITQLQAMTDELEENTLSQVFQKGFKIGDKIVRFAMVQVAN